jgi:membrane-bound serine protease (ClpP class)
MYHKTGRFNVRYHARPLIGKIGVTDSELRPSGTVIIDNEIYDAKTDGDFIEAGRGVRVTRVKGKKIFVRRV